MVVFYVFRICNLSQSQNGLACVHFFNFQWDNFHPMTKTHVLELSSSIETRNSFMWYQWPLWPISPRGSQWGFAFHWSKVRWSMLTCEHSFSDYISYFDFSGHIYRFFQKEGALFLCYTDSKKKKKNQNHFAKSLKNYSLLFKVHVFQQMSNPWFTIFNLAAGQSFQNIYWYAVISVDS